MCVNCGCFLSVRQFSGHVRVNDVCVCTAHQYWLSARQMAVEGGFQGRSNKLVDGCYSFWQGATFAVVAAATGDGTVHVFMCAFTFSFLYDCGV